MLSSFLAQLKSGMDFTNQEIASGDGVKLLSLKKQLIQRLKQLNSSKIECKPCIDDYLKLEVHQTVCDIKNMASLNYLPIDPPKCTVNTVGGEEGVINESVVKQTKQRRDRQKERKKEKKEKESTRIMAK